MGTQKACKYYCLIALLLFLSACVTIKEYKPTSLNGLKIKVSVKNLSFEPKITAVFTKTIEDRLARRGAIIVDKEEVYEVIVTINNIKTNALAYTSADVIGAYSVQISGAFSIVSHGNEKANTPVVTGVFNPIYHYTVKNVIESENERTKAIEKSAVETAESIYGKLFILPERL